MESPSRWAIHTIRPLEKYALGSVILLGDAVRILIHSDIVATVLINFYLERINQAHAMAPHQGNGAGQAIEVSDIAAKNPTWTRKILGRLHPRPSHLPSRP